MNVDGIDLEWLGHSGFVCGTDPRIVFDPFRVQRPEPVDVAFVTHPHFDHLSPDDLDAFVGPDTTIVSVDDAGQEVAEHWPDRDFVSIEPGTSTSVSGVDVEAVPAYNLDKTYHPRDRGWVGFVVEVDGTRVYHAGDTDRIPEMEGLDVDVALLPVGGTYVMDVGQAVEAVDVLDPVAAVPMHFGTTVGTARDARRFRDRVGDRVVLPEEVDDDG